MRRIPPRVRTLFGPAIIRELLGARSHERAAAARHATTGRLTTGARHLAVSEGIVVLDTAVLDTAVLDTAVLATWEARLCPNGLVVGTYLAPYARESPELFSRDSLRPPLRS